jgi:hypothetical protein
MRSRRLRLSGRRARVQTHSPTEDFQTTATQHGGTDEARQLREAFDGHPWWVALVDIADASIPFRSQVGKSSSGTARD